MSKALVTNMSEGTSGELIQLVSFNIGPEEYGTEVLKVREIIRVISITRMPNTPHYVEGIINLRGKVIPIISMRKKFGLEDREIDNHTRIMVMDIGGDLMGFVVDAVSEVIRVAGSEIQPAPTAATEVTGQNCITGVINKADKLLVLIDLDLLFLPGEILVPGV